MTTSDTEKSGLTALLDITLSRDEAAFIASFLIDDQEPGDDAVRLLLGEGHSGHGLYAAHPEYPEEGAIFVKAVPSRRSTAGDQPSNGHRPESAAPQPAGTQSDTERDAARTLDHGLNKGVAMWLKNFLKPGEKVIWREPFRWKDEDGVLSNHSEMFDLPQLAADFGYEIVEDFHHAAIVRAAMGTQPADKENGNG